VQCLPLASPAAGEKTELLIVAMKISYDAEADALYIRLLDAKEVLGKGVLPTIVFENIPAVQAGV
jgi:hypothetical protein